MDRKWRLCSKGEIIVLSMKMVNRSAPAQIKMIIWYEINYKHKDDLAEKFY